MGDKEHNPLFVLYMIPSNCFVRDKLLLTRLKTLDPRSTRIYAITSYICAMHSFSLFDILYVISFS